MAKMFLFERFFSRIFDVVLCFSVLFYTCIKKISLAEQKYFLQLHLTLTLSLTSIIIRTSPLHLLKAKARIINLEFLAVASVENFILTHC